LKRFLFSLFF